MRTCPSCGIENADTAKFCSECGSALTAKSSARREERKVVTVVFADLVGSTARAERLDPEDVRAILAPYHDRLRAELERRGGTVEKFIGDAVVGVFGAPVAHEDDAERGVRSALAIQDAIAELNESNEALELEVRIGVNTGEALVSIDARPELGEAMVAGDVMNTAARMQSAAPPGGVLVGEATYRSTSRAIEYSDADPLIAKGKSEPIPVWAAVAPRSRFGVDVFQTGRASLVGRERELDLLVGALARVRAASEPQLVTLVGVPGIGKSRLVSELARIADEDDESIIWRQGRSLAYGEGVAFWALGEIVKAQIGILESDSVSEAATKLAAAVADLVPDVETAWLERHLRPLVGLGGESDGGEGLQAEAFSAWRRFFEALGERSPTVVVFEDLHWAEDGLLDFVDGLVERVAGVPLLVVCSARPELLERRPGWGGGKRNAYSISLAPLSNEETARLIAILLDRPVLAADQQAVLLQRAGGNPLYAEEYARMSEATPMLEEVPDTLQGVVAARIDALAPAEKELLQQASVLGKVFWTDGLAASLGLDEWDVDERLHTLERKEFVRRERRSAVADAKQYVFVHALVRDGAYGQMPRAARGQAHARVAEWIGSLPSDRAEDRAEMLAHHLIAAVEYGRAAGVDVTELLPKAAQAARDAGDRAWTLGAPGSALTLYEQSRSLDPNVGDDPYLLLRLGRARFLMLGEGEEELERAARALEESDPAAAAEAEVMRGEIVWQRGDQDSAFPYFERASASVAKLAPSRQKLYVVNQVARFLGLAGSHSESLELAEQAITMAQDLNDEELLSDVLNTRGIVRRALGEADGIVDIKRSLEIALELKSYRAARGYINLGSELHGFDGDVMEAAATYREGLGFVERLGVGLSRRWLVGNLAESSLHLGLWDEAMALAEGEIADPSPHYMQQLCRIVRAHIRLARGDIPGAIEDVERAAEEARAIRDPQALVPALTTRAFCAVRTGDVAGGAAALDELASAVGELGPAAGLAGSWVVELAFSLLELGRESELSAGKHQLGPQTPWREAAAALGRGELVPAADMMREIGSLTFEAHARLRAARQLSADGRRAEAAEQLGLALSFYRGVDASAALREGEALLAAAS